MELKRGGLHLEDTNQSILDLPAKYYERVTQKFKFFLSEAVTSNGFSISYINNILSTVVDFYFQIERNGLLPQASIENSPFTQASRKVMVENQVGLLRGIDVLTSDLRIKGGRKTEVEIGRIRDGGNLRPLTNQEQKVIFEGF